uniref:Uncharacterized protein n=1 Tax=Timema monikensis TaxID=170555 RepID=A0A7R9EDB7_9NEOP|nr:unnamed protein product [Timema monikensis]
MLKNEDDISQGSLWRKMSRSVSDTTLRHPRPNLSLPLPSVTSLMQFKTVVFEEVLPLVASEKDEETRNHSDSHMWKVLFSVPDQYPIPYLTVNDDLSTIQKELSFSRRNSRVAHRKSLITTTSPTLPRCHSPISDIFKNAATLRIEI